MNLLGDGPSAQAPLLISQRAAQHSPCACTMALSHFIWCLQARSSLAFTHRPSLQLLPFTLPFTHRTLRHCKMSTQCFGSMIEPQGQQDLAFPRPLTSIRQGLCTLAAAAKRHRDKGFLFRAPACAERLPFPGTPTFKFPTRAFQAPRAGCRFDPGVLPLVDHSLSAWLLPFQPRQEPDRHQSDGFPNNSMVTA